MNKMQKISGMVMAAALACVFAVAQPATAQMRRPAPAASAPIAVDLGSSLFQVTGTMTTTTGVTSTADLTGTTAVTITGATTTTTPSGSVLLPATGADLSQQQRNVNMEVIPLLMLLSGAALLVAVGLMSLAQRDYRRQNDDQWQ